MTDARDRADTSIQSSIERIWTWLAGDYRNQAQALSDPAWFVSLCLWQRPFWLQGQPALFLEQANAMQPDKPYRQRIMVLRDRDIQFYGFKQPELFKGCGLNPERLNSLAADAVELLPGCVLQLTLTIDRLEATMAPDAVCQFRAEGVTRQVVLGFAATATTLETRDRGVDPETGQSLWGAIMGPYRFEKVASYALPNPTAPARD